MERWQHHMESECKLSFFDFEFELMQDPKSNDLGTTVWDCSIVLCKWLENHRNKRGIFQQKQMSGKRVLELGAGTGLLGLVLAKMGCHVTLTDLDAMVPLLQTNVDVNKIRMKSQGFNYGSAQVKTLQWGNKEHIESLSDSYAFIFGSDCIYEESVLPVLFETVLKCSSKKTVIVFANEKRNISIHERFIQLSDQLNFHVKIIPRTPEIDIFIMRQ